MNQDAAKPFQPSGMIEFNVVELDDARKEAEHPAAWVAMERLMPGYWEEQRRPPTATDRALTGKTIDWMLKLPAEARPKALSTQFPRIVNHLADGWHDLANTRLALMRLLADERGGRKGFSLQIEQEIGRLAAQVQATLDVVPTQPAAL
ncbi:MAG: hypothetical protein U1E89_12310 [Burkholderiaceae bacterium]